MAFQCTANHPGRLGNYPRLGTNGRWDVLTEVGFDGNVPITFYFSVHTYPTNGETEFGFCLAWSFNQTGEQGFSYESSLVKQAIPSFCRIQMRPILLHYSELIIRISQPDRFFMETFTPGLPQQALVKYGLLNQIFIGLGYTVAPAATLPGKHKWVMERS